MTVNEVINHLQNGEYQQAVATADELLLAGGDKRELLPLKVSALIELGQAVPAKQGAADLLALLPQDAYARFLYLRVRFLQGERDLQADLQNVLKNADNLTPPVKEKIYNLLGQCCRFFGDADGAVSAYKRAAKDADDLYLKAAEYSNVLFNQHYCDKITAAERKKTAKEYGDLFKSVVQFFHGPAEKKSKLRIGYLSADIREHVVLKFCYALFRSYDREKYTVYCYARNLEDGYSRKIMGMVDGWRNLTGMTFLEAAQVIYNDDIDILIDLGGHTQGNGLPILAYKPARIQISGIGYFATTGLNSVDYYLSDAYICGLDKQEMPLLAESPDFFEKILVMPQTHFCYLPFGGLPVVSEAPCLKNGYVTFGSFNNFTKVTDAVMQVWGQIMQRVPRARLLLKAELFNTSAGREQAANRLQAAGVDISRVEFRGFTKDYMAEYGDVDIALDTFPYPGGGTTLDALYMGVPVISLVGQAHGERFGLSILQNLGLAEFAVDSVEQYIEQAAGLAGDFELLAVLHQNLRTMLKNSPLMAEKDYVKNMEAGYELVWQEYSADYKPLSVREAAQKVPQLRQFLSAGDYHQAVELAKIIEKAGHLDSHALEELAAVYIDMSNVAGAERVTMALLKKKPQDGYALFLRSRARFCAKDFAQSIALAKQALQVQNLSAENRLLTLDILAKACKESGQAGAALEAYWQAVELETDIVNKCQHYDNYLLTMHYTESDGQFLREKAEGCNQFYKNIQRYRHLKNHRHKKLRIGYISADFCRHVMSNFCRGLLKEYDRWAFAVYVYDTGANYDEITAEFQEYPDVWRDISRMSDAEAAQLIVNDEIDILVDLSGHTKGNRLGVFAYKPAPVQVSGLGYMSTTGLPEMDYFLGDVYLDDEAARQDFTEQVVALPHSHFLYLPLNFPPVTEPAPYLVNGYVTFGCFNNFTKVTNTMLKNWAEIMKQVPESRLLLKAAAFDDKFSRQRAEERLAGAGIDLKYVILEGWSNDYFAAYNKVDIALDTYPYPGGGTTCDALFMGVPVISLAGKRHGTRFGYSLLSNVGLADLCSFTAADYIKTAVRLAKDLPRLNELHLVLRRRVQVSAVGNAERYMIDLEMAYQHMWLRYLTESKLDVPLPDMLTEFQTAVDKQEWAEVISIGQTAYIRETDEGNRGYIVSALAMAYYELKSPRRMAFWAETAAQFKNTIITEPELYAIAERGHSKACRFVSAREMAKKALNIYQRTTLSTAPGTETSLRAAVSHTDFQFGLPQSVENYRQAMLTDTTGLAHKAAMYSSMLLSMHLGQADATEMFKAHIDYQSLFAGISPYIHQRHNHKKLRIGYLSPDFRQHVMYTFIFPLLANYDQDNFEVYCYSLVEKDDEYTRILQSFADGWRDLYGHSLMEQAKQIYDDEIDILIDLAGHSSDSGLPVLAYKLAPVQISGLGYMDTTGLSLTDYYLADAAAVLPEQEKYFTEKIIRLRTMFCSAGRLKMPESAGTPAKEKGWIVFGIFNNYRKYQNEILLAWKEILQQVPGSRLLLKCDVYIDPMAADVAYERLKSLGLPMERVQIEPASQDYLQRYLDVDIALDTYPWPGGGTTVDALYMGVPVVSLYGERFGSRFGLSILTAAGLSELAVGSIQEYIDRAVALAKDFETLDVLHKNLRKMIEGSPLFAADEYVRDLENNYRRVWAEYEKTFA